MTYMEWAILMREWAILMRKSKAVWRMGHGNPAPVEMLTGYNLPNLAERSLDLMDEMLSGFSGAKKAAAEIETVYSNEKELLRYPTPRSNCSGKAATAC
jgi:hypothetical protein